MRLATLALAAAFFIPTASAQLVTSTESMAAVDVQRLAPGDSSVVSNVPEGTDQLVTFTLGPAGSTDFLFGTNGIGIAAFGSGYTLPSDAAFEALGAILYVTRVPAGAAETFKVNVFNGTLADGPTGASLYTQTYSGADITPPGDGSISPTVLDFDTPVPLSGPVFFVTYDVSGISSQFALGSTDDLDVDAPEPFLLFGGAWTQAQALVGSAEDPLQVQLFADILIRERAGTASESGAERAGIALSTSRPNPATDRARVTISLATPSLASLAVYDLLGREVARVVDRDLPAGDTEASVDVSGLSAGTYLLRLTAGGATTARPFSVAR